MCIEGSTLLIESGAIAWPRMPHSTENPRTITELSFTRLLARLHADRDEAAHEYERLHRSLVKFFDWRGASPPEECADEALDRLARKLEETAVEDVRKYVHGIARLVLLERQRGPKFSPIDDVLPVTVAAETVSSNEGGERQDCFDRCLAELPDDGRSLVLRYYEGERTAKITNRRRLATALGVTENALRSRVQRLRDRLEQCMQSCSSQQLTFTP